MSLYLLPAVQLLCCRFTSTTSKLFVEEAWLKEKVRKGPSHMLQFFQVVQREQQCAGKRIFVVPTRATSNL